MTDVQWVQRRLIPNDIIYERLSHVSIRELWANTRFAFPIHTYAEIRRRLPRITIQMELQSDIPNTMWRCELEYVRVEELANTQRAAFKMVGCARVVSQHVDTFVAEHLPMLRQRLRRDILYDASLRTKVELDPQDTMTTRPAWLNVSCKIMDIEWKQGEDYMTLNYYDLLDMVCKELDETDPGILKMERAFCAWYDRMSERIMRSYHRRMIWYRCIGICAVALACVFPHSLGIDVILDILVIPSIPHTMDGVTIGSYLWLAVFFTIQPFEAGSWKHLFLFFVDLRATAASTASILEGEGPKRLVDRLAPLWVLLRIMGTPLGILYVLEKEHLQEHGLNCNCTMENR